MRSTWFIFIVSVFCSHRLPAQTSPYLATISEQRVALHSGPSAEMPETGEIFRGTEVVVHHEEPNGWLAIQAPRGQVSWIRHLNLGPIGNAGHDTVPRNMIVHASPEAEIAYGRTEFAKPLDVRRTRVPDSTIVLVIGGKVEHAGSYWYPIVPPYGDFRYIPASSVQSVNGKATQSFVVRSPKSEPLPTVQTAVASIPNTDSQPSSHSGSNHPLWVQAEQAERNGEYAKAEALYLRLSAEMNQPGGDPDLANLCYTRVHAVRERQRPRQRAGGSNTPSSRSGSTTTEHWIGAGILRPAGIRINNRVTYALQGPQGETRFYAVAGSGVNLERFQGDEVDLYGPVAYPGELRGVGVVTAGRVNLVRVK